MRAKWYIVAFLSVFLFVSANAGTANCSEKEFEIGITKGVYAIEIGSYEEAQSYLRKALSINNSDPNALLFLGIALSRDEKYSEAKKYLDKALQVSPELLRAKFELGVVHYHLGSWEEAGVLFREVRASRAEKQIRSAARKYLYRMAGQDEKPYSLEFYAGWQYDDNVILEQEGSISTSGRDQSDWRWLVLIDGQRIFFQDDRFKVEGGYSFYHSFHNSLDEFDSGQHNLSLAGTYDPDGPLKVKVEYKLSYTRVNGEEFSRISSLSPVISVAHSSIFLTELHYSREFQDFYDVEMSNLNKYRTGNNNAFGLTEKILINKNTLLSLDYTYSNKTTDNDRFWSWTSWRYWTSEFWEHEGHKGTVKFTANMKKWQLFLSASYHDRQYGVWPDSSPLTERRDKRQEYSAAITWNPVNWLSISLTDSYIINNSTLPEAEYNRNIIGLVAGVAL